MTVDELANLIRTLDGNHDLGAGAFAERLMPHIATATQQAAQHGAAQALRNAADIITEAQFTNHVGYRRWLLDAADNASEGKPIEWSRPRRR